MSAFTLINLDSEHIPTKKHSKHEQTGENKDFCFYEILLNY